MYSPALTQPPSYCTPQSTPTLHDTGRYAWSLQRDPSYSVIPATSASSLAASRGLHDDNLGGGGSWLAQGGLAGDGRAVDFLWRVACEEEARGQRFA